MKAIIITYAYNAGKTIHHTIESILAQSHQDFVYYIVDNGSTDRTGKIIRTYAQKDSRIIQISRPENNILIFFEILPEILKKHKTDYLCVIDADDTYNPDFLEKMLSFMKKEHLDIAACGSDFIDSVSKKIKGVRKLNNDLIIEGQSFEEYLPRYYQFMRTVWGKMYSVSVLLEDKFDPRDEISYGGDTLFAIEAFRRANRVGILAEPLHKYYISQKSSSYQFNSKRIISDRILYDVAYDFLIDKTGEVSIDNKAFLLSVYFYAVLDTLQVLIRSKISVSDKFECLLDIIQSWHTQALIEWNGMIEEKKQLFQQVGGWVLSQPNVHSDIGLETAASILAATGTYPTKIKGWKDSWVFMLLTKIKDKLTKKDLLNDINSQIISMTSELPLLSDFNVEFVTFFRKIIFFIIQFEEKKALRQIENLIDKGTDIPNEHLEDFLTLALNLSAKLECADDFIYFKKLYISVLLDLSRTDEAEQELADWNELLPSDLDFKELSTRLMMLS